MADTRTVEVYKDRAGKWRWRVVAERGNLPREIIAAAGHGKANKGHVVSMAESLFPGYPMVEVK